MMFITVFYHILGRISSKFLIWISVFVLMTVCNWYASAFLQFLSQELSSRQRYFVEFSVVTQMFRTVSYALTVSDQLEKDSVLEAVEYNFYLPIFCGPWCIYPIFRANRIKRSQKVV